MAVHSVFFHTFPLCACELFYGFILDLVACGISFLIIMADYGNFFIYARHFMDDCVNKHGHSLEVVWVLDDLDLIISKTCVS